MSVAREHQPTAALDPVTLFFFLFLSLLWLMSPWIDTIKSSASQATGILGTAVHERDVRNSAESFQFEVAISIFRVQ